MFLYKGKRLGGESSYTGAVGTDSFGKIMISAIQNKGVDTSHIQVLDGKTAVTHVDIVLYSGLIPFNSNFLVSIILYFPQMRGKKR